MSRRYLLVTVNDGKSLIACEKNGTSSPYLSASLLNMTSREIKNEKDKTDYKPRTLNPKWEHRMTFGASYDLNNVDVLPTLSIKVFHKGSTFSADQPMGIVEIPLDSIDPGGAPSKQWYPLEKTGRMKDVAVRID
jgi:Ca2+-dependent lipid-binding protein